MNLIKFVNKITNYFKYHSKSPPTMRKKYQIPSQQEPYLCLGALLVTQNGDPDKHLTMNSNVNLVKRLLEEDWEIGDTQATRLTIETLLDSVAENIEALQSYFTHGQQTLEADELSAIALIKAQYGEHAVTVCSTPIAFELERAAFLVRAACYVNYISDQEAWRYLKNIACHLKGFNCWQQYVISFLMGRVLMYSTDIEDMITTANRLLNNQASLWNKYDIRQL